ncbi:VOC family protein [Cohnella lubricantis]|uniref:VOC family protein n=1 Tax=Cohnella lubricantis TaxID=2163172 RepID=A0A841TGK7_9BACL|nr:VOC family protein [Cohnella lubricantis]MBB6679506.1 VOC family protein [Cohnella lubricantis]MBP2118098.1 PhnB protein [Cohnella lubricantis]
MPLNAYLNFNGNTREVVLFYAEVFGLPEPVFSTFGSMPEEPAHPLPPAAKDLIMHAQLTIAGSALMFSDVFPGMPYQRGTNDFSLAYVSKDEAAIRDAFHKLMEGGEVRMELQEVPWSPCYGMVKDKYGIGWQLSLES